MQLHQLRPTLRRAREKRVGRGGKRGKTAGRGTKGQRARAGARIRPAIRDVLKKLPKRRGYRFRSFRPKPTVLDVGALAERFEAGAVVDAARLLAAGLLRRRAGKVGAVKVVGSGGLEKPLTLRGLAISAAARRAIEAAGGSVR